jgi:hypothetical protein
VACPRIGSERADRWSCSSWARALDFFSFAWIRSRRRRALGPVRAMREVEKGEDWRGLEGVLRRQEREDIERDDKALARPRQVAMSKMFLNISEVRISNFSHAHAASIAIQHTHLPPDD